VADDARRLDVPRGRGPRLSLAVRMDPDAVGRFAETTARLMGTGRFLTLQTVLVLIWVAVNIWWVQVRWDPYPFILLNLMFSVQAAYAAPLILLAQNRQAERDRVQAEEDRARAAQTRADTEYLARELAALRVAIGELATRDFIRSELNRLTEDGEARERERAKRRPDVVG
jgi:uncharacterized membrane protein